MSRDYTHYDDLDRSGSMEAIREDVIGGSISFVQEQQKQTGQATLTPGSQFDSQDPYEIVHRVQPIQTIPPLTRETYTPRASTPLLDAMGRGINDLERSIAGMKEDERPDNVVMAIITDGQENYSREFTKDQIVKWSRRNQRKMLGSSYSCLRTWVPSETLLPTVSSHKPPFFSRKTPEELLMLTPR